MKRWQVSIVAILILASPGCRMQQLRRANEALERENFCLEQQIDELSWQIDDMKAELEACRRDATSGTSRPAPRGRTYRDDLDPDDLGPTAPPAVEPSREPRVELPDEDAAMRGPVRREQASQFGGPPIISPPNPNVPEGVLRHPVDHQPGNGLPDEPPAELVPAPVDGGAAAHSLGTGASAPQARLIVDDGASMAALAVNAQLTVWQRDASGPGGLRVVVEPRDASGNLLLVQGDVAIAVLDPAVAGPAARIARWDYRADEVAQYFRDAKPGGGFHFDLAWPADAPRGDSLELFVRLSLPDGRQFVAEYTLQPQTSDAPGGTSTSSVAPASLPVLVPPPATSAAAGSQGGAGWQRSRTRPPALVPLTTVDAQAAAPGNRELGNTSNSSAARRPTWEPYR